MSNGEAAYNAYVAHESAIRASGGSQFLGWSQLGADKQSLWESVAHAARNPGQIPAEFDPVVANGGPLVLTGVEATQTDVGAPLTAAADADEDTQQS